MIMEMTEKQIGIAIKTVRADRDKLIDKLIAERDGIDNLNEEDHAKISTKHDKLMDLVNRSDVIDFCKRLGYTIKA